MGFALAIHYFGKPTISITLNLINQPVTVCECAAALDAVNASLPGSF